MSVSSCSSVPRSPPCFAWSSTQSGESDAGCQLPPRVNHGGTHRSTLGLASPGVPRSGSEIPSYGGTQQERHPHTVRLECRSSVTRIVAPAELPRLGVPTLAKGGGSCARGSRVGGGTDVSSGGGSTPPNAAVGARWRSMHVLFVTSAII